MGSLAVTILLVVAVLITCCLWDGYQIQHKLKRELQLLDQLRAHGPSCQCQACQQAMAELMRMADEP